MKEWLYLRAQLAATRIAVHILLAKLWCRYVFGSDEDRAVIEEGMPEFWRLEEEFKAWKRTQKRR